MGVGVAGMVIGFGVGCAVALISSGPGGIPVLGSFFRGSSGSIVSLSGLYSSFVVTVL